MENTVPSQPFEKIALSCSGGGYRAASFHLGSMSYLNRLQFNGRPLLENVKLISTVSGGTITGIVYALMKQDNKSFAEIYNFLLKTLLEFDLVKTGIMRLNPDAPWINLNKSKNLINAFAELYDEKFTGGAVLAAFNTMNSHLDAVVFNSTEFNNGINFRFKNPEARSYSGNYSIRVNNEQAKEVKLSDIMASSSCFPGGFEPMLWPDDFIHRDATSLKALSDKYIAEEKKSVGIMDGGVYDNQGIESILNYRKTAEAPYFDLVIISDVASPDMKPYLRFTEKPKSGWKALTLKELKDKVVRVNQRINRVLIALIVGLSILPLIWQYHSDWRTGVALTLAVVFLILFLLKSLVIKRIKGLKIRLFQKVTKVIPEYYVDKLSHLKIEELSVHRVEPLIMARLNSLLTLLMDVFLKVVRRLNYDKLYEDDRYTFRRISNLIKELTEEDYKKKSKSGSEEEGDGNRILKGSYEEAIGPRIKDVAEAAAAVGNSLWFTDQEKLDEVLKKLVACGQFTMCYNMIRYLEDLIYTKGNGYEPLDPAVKIEIVSLYDQCRADWTRFKDDPFFLADVKPV